MYNLEKGSKKLLNALLAISGIFLVVLIISAVIDIQDKLTKTENTITISETGLIYVKPDLALADFSVTTESKTTEKAMSENTRKMNSLISFMKEQGIEDKDLKTTNFYIYPRYEWYDKSDFYPSGKRILAGYEITQTLQVKIRDMEKIGKIIEGGTSLGANQISDLRFIVDNQEELKKQAREQAIAKVRIKKEELAKQLGIKLVRIISFSENNIAPAYYGSDYGSEKMLGMGGAETPQIQTGENKIEATVSITYEIN